MIARATEITRREAVGCVWFSAPFILSHESKRKGVQKEQERSSEGAGKQTDMEPQRRAVDQRHCGNEREVKTGLEKEVLIWDLLTQTGLLGQVPSCLLPLSASCLLPLSCVLCAALLPLCSGRRSRSIRPERYNMETPEKGDQELSWRRSAGSCFTRNRVKAAASPPVW